MTQAKRNKSGKPDARRHQPEDLFGNWPTPADVVKGFGGDPEKTEHKQWISKGGAPDPK